MSNERNDDPNAGRKHYRFDAISGRWYHKSHVSKLDAKRRARGELTNADVARSGNGPGRPAMVENPSGENNNVAELAREIANTEQQRQRKRITGAADTADFGDTTGTADSTQEIFPQGQTDNPTFEVEEGQAQPREKRGRKPSRTAQADANYITENLLDVVNLTAKTFFGDVGEMTQQERKDIEKPLSRILSRMDARIMDTAQTFADPVALIFAASAWAIRIRVTRQMQRERNKPPQPEQTPQAQPTATPTPNEPQNNYPVGVNPMTANLSTLGGYLT